MEIMTINGTEIKVTAGEARVITLLKKGVCAGSAFEQGSGRYKRTDMPQTDSRREALSIVLLSKKDVPQHEFFATHPRHQFAYMLRESPRVLWLL
jgi:hypothetical protein